MPALFAGPADREQSAMSDTHAHRSNAAPNRTRATPASGTPAMVRTARACGQVELSGRWRRTEGTEITEQALTRRRGGTEVISKQKNSVPPCLRVDLVPCPPSPPCPLASYADGSES